MSNQPQGATMTTISIRHERRALGTAANFGHDVDYFGLFFEDTAKFVVRSINGAASALMADGGMNFANAEALCRYVAAEDKAFDVSGGVVEEL
tara:strand:+ start:1070 stop:1348 length:279 start_codon:yes stop_codon:yes gene_type:complete